MVADRWLDGGWMVAERRLHIGCAAADGRTRSETPEHVGQLVWRTSGTRWGLLGKCVDTA
eukprot:11195804-Lingulodinium_polyedra.AAC.1